MSVSKSVATQKMLAKLVFSIATSKVTFNGSDKEEMDEEEGSDYEEGPAKKTEVEIKGMQILTRGQRKNESSDSEQEEESVEDSKVHDHEETAQLTKNMNAAQLNCCHWMEIRTWKTMTRSSTMP